MLWDEYANKFVHTLVAKHYNATTVKGAKTPMWITPKRIPNSRKRFYFTTVNNQPIVVQKG